jgi:alkylation response protein AidB-like acyl-CoA dehydrogenase
VQPDTGRTDSSVVPFYDDDHETFRATVRRFVKREVVPRLDDWDRAGIVARRFFRAAGDAGLLAMAAPEQFGGAGVEDFRFNLVIGEEFAAIGANAAALAITLHNDIVLPYLLRYATAEQQARWLPGVVAGELVLAIAMTEPGAGSDLAAIRASAHRRGGHYVVNGSKTFITNGINGDLVVTALRTDAASRHGGITLLVLERDMPGLTRGRNLDKIGLHAQDTAELFFDDIAVPVENRLGDEGAAFGYLMSNLPKERLSIGAFGVAAAAYALRLTVEHSLSRRAFGQPIAALQNTRFKLAELQTEIEVGRAFIRHCVLELNAGTLTAERAAMAKWWCTEMHTRCVDVCLQLHGGYGYMREHPISRAYLDARVTTIYGGTTEIMKDIIGRGVVAEHSRSA